MSAVAIKPERSRQPREVSPLMVRLVAALERAALASLWRRRKTASARAALLAAITALETELHDARGQLFKAQLALELAQVELGENLQQLADALDMPPSATMQEVLARIVQGNLAGNIREIDRMLDAGKPGVR